MSQNQEKPIIHAPTIQGYKDAAQTAEELSKSANTGGTAGGATNQGVMEPPQGTTQTNPGETETGADTVTPQSTTTTTDQQLQQQGARKVIPHIDMTATDHAIMNHYIQIIALLQNKISLIDPRLQQ